MKDELADADDRQVFHIGVTGPASPRLFASDLEIPAEKLPKGNGGTPVNHLVRAWLDAGRRVTLATLDPAHTSSEIESFQGAHLTVAVGYHRPCRCARDLFKIEREAVREALLRFRPDAVSAHWSYEYAMGAIESGIPTMVTVHDVPRVVFRMHPHPYRLVRWWMHSRVMKRARRVVFNSPYTRDQVAGDHADANSVFSNVIPDNLWRLTDREYPHPQAPRYISVNNGFGSRKNVERLLEAFALVRADLPASQLQLVGDGFGPEGKADQWANQNGLGTGVKFVGMKGNAETLELIRKSDVLVHPSIEESFGYTLIEAASVGTPVIAGQDSGAVPWVLGDGRCGVLVDVTDPKSIADAMQKLVAEPERWWRLRQDAFATAKFRFSASKVAEDYVTALKDIIR